MPNSSPTPLVLLHGFADTPRTWALVRPALERHHRVVALALPGHLGGPALRAPVAIDAIVDQVEAALDDAGVGLAHVAGNSLGGYLALRLAERGRARGVVALAPAGGWADDDRSWEALLAHQLELVAGSRAAAPHADALAATPAGRRRVLADLVADGDHVPAEVVAELIRGAAGCDAEPLVAGARASGWPLDPARIDCPVRIVWGTADRLLPWPSAAARFERALPHADWVVLDGVGHAPQLEVPLEAAQLILGWT